MEYTIVRSKRKTIAIHIKPDATIEVRAPLKTPKSEIERLLAEKEKWITQHTAVRRERLESRAAFALNYGDSVPMQGREYPIVAKPGNRVGFDDVSFYMPPNLPPESIKSAVVFVNRKL